MKPTAFGEETARKLHAMANGPQASGSAFDVPFSKDSTEVIFLVTSAVTACGTQSTSGYAMGSGQGRWCTIESGTLTPFAGATHPLANPFTDTFPVDTFVFASKIQGYWVITGAIDYCPT